MAVELAASQRTSGRVVSAELLTAAPAIVGRPLAEPWRRLAAMIVDLAIVALLSLLTGPWLGLGTGLMLLVLFGNSRDVPIVLKAVRTFCRALGGLLIALSILALGHFSLIRQGALHLDVFTGRAPSAAMKETVYVAPDASFNELRNATARLEKQVAELKKENAELQEARKSWLYQSRAFASTLGVTFGWSGVYFTLMAGLLGGRTLGKSLVGTRAVKANGTPFTFFDGFVRHGGYVAGVAMGLTGFLKLLWDPNRQAVEDRIASTVVVRG